MVKTGSCLIVANAMPLAVRYFSVDSMSETIRLGDYSTILCVVNDLINI